MLTPQWHGYSCASPWWMQPWLSNSWLLDVLRTTCHSWARVQQDIVCDPPPHVKQVLLFPSFFQQVQWMYSKPEALKLAPVIVKFVSLSLFKPQLSKPSMLTVPSEQKVIPQSSSLDPASRSKSISSLGSVGIKQYFISLKIKCIKCKVQIYSGWEIRLDCAYRPQHMYASAAPDTMLNKNE